MISNMGRNLQRYYDEAILRGKKEEKIITARNFLRMNIDVKLVATGTELPLAEVEKLKLEVESEKCFVVLENDKIYEVSCRSDRINIGRAREGKIRNLK